MNTSCKFTLGLAGLLAFSVLLFGTPQQAPHEPGVVYYADGADFKALEREPAPQSGHAHYSSKVKGAHASVRFATGKPLTFRVCSADPMRYKLYVFRPTKNSREVVIATANVWIGGVKTVLSESEIPVTVKAADDGCFTITTKEPLKDGEYGFGPVGEESVFMFGVGEAKKPK